MFFFALTAHVFVLVREHTVKRGRCRTGNGHVDPAAPQASGPMSTS